MSLLPTTTTNIITAHHHTGQFLVENENKPNLCLVSDDPRPGEVDCLMLGLARRQESVVSDERWQVVMPPVLAATAGV